MTKRTDPIFRVEVSGRMQGWLHIQAPDEESAMRLANDLPMPADGRTIGGFDDFQVDGADPEAQPINQCSCQCGCANSVKPKTALQLCRGCKAKAKTNKDHTLAVAPPVCAVCDETYDPLYPCHCAKHLDEMSDGLCDACIAEDVAENGPA